MSFIRCIILALTTIFITSCSSSNVPQELNSFVDNTELKSSEYDAEDWQKSMFQYEKLVEEYSNSGKEYTDAEKQMAARAMGRYHSLLIRNGIEQSAAYLKELESILPSYFEGLVDGFGEDSGLEKALERFDNKLEEIFERIEGTE